MIDYELHLFCCVCVRRRCLLFYNSPSHFAHFCQLSGTDRYSVCEQRERETFNTIGTRKVKSFSRTESRACRYFATTVCVITELTHQQHRDNPVQNQTRERLTNNTQSPLTNRHPKTYNYCSSKWPLPVSYFWTVAIIPLARSICMVCTQ